MAQREQHERVKRMDRLADKLLGHKAVVMAILVVIAMASGWRWRTLAAVPAVCRLSALTVRAR